MSYDIEIFWVNFIFAFGVSVSCLSSACLNGRARTLKRITVDTYVFINEVLKMEEKNAVSKLIYS